MGREIAIIIEKSRSMPDYTHFKNLLQLFFSSCNFRLMKSYEFFCLFSSKNVVPEVQL